MGNDKPSPAPAVTEAERFAAGRAFLQAMSPLGGISTEASVAGWLNSDTGLAVIAALEAAATVRNTSDPQGEAISPWARAQASASAGLCMCHACMHARGEIQVTMHLCPKCGNKRCPKANNHAFRCTGSNAIGQAGEMEGEPPPLAPVAAAIRAMPAARRDLDRMGEAIRVLQGSPVMGRAIGRDGR